jgi:RHS repeat-associated protein
LQGRAVARAQSRALRNPRSTTEIDTDQSYDTLGRELETFQPAYAGLTQYNNVTKGYDELNRVTSVVASDELGNPQSTNTYYHGLSSTVTNPAQQSKTDNKDAVGQLAQSLDPAGNPTSFTRDAYGDLTQTTDPKGNNVTITYDNLGRKIKMVDPDLGRIDYCIDPRGLLWQQISPIERAKIGTQTSYCTQRWNSGTASATNFFYDVLDRMTERQEPDLDSHWAYDSQVGSSSCGSATGASQGKLVEAYSVLGNGTKDYDRVESYDNIGRQSQSMTCLGQATVTSVVAYDSWGRTSSTTRGIAGDSAGSKIYSQYYNSNGYLAQIARTVSAGTTVLWETKRQDAGNRVLDTALGNGLFINREYNPYTERLNDGLITKNGANTLVFHENYQYDILGNVSNRAQEWGDAQSSNYSEAFSYDSLNRLITSQVFGSSTSQQGFGYDVLGNIICKSGVGGASVTCTPDVNGNVPSNQQTYTYGSSGSNIAGPHAVTAIAGIGSFTYDADGNLTSGAGRSYTASGSFGPWTSFDMPNTITEGSSTSTFTYGPEHQRATQTRGDMALYYADGVEVDIPTGGSMGNATVKTYWPAGLGVETDSTSGTTQRWTHDDRLGSVTAITDEQGNLAQEMAYDAWGSRRNLLGNAAVAVDSSNKLAGVPLVDNKGFTGQEELDQLGLVHLNGRIYDPLVGRFLSADPEIQDPTHTQSYNRYSYVWNNPTNDTDPTGFEAVPIPVIEIKAPWPDWTICKGECVSRFLAGARAFASTRATLVGARAIPTLGAAYVGWRVGYATGTRAYDNGLWKVVAFGSGPGVTELMNQGMKAAEEKKDEEALARKFHA